MSVLAQLFVNALHLATKEELLTTVGDTTLMAATRYLASKELQRRDEATLLFNGSLD